MLPDSNMACNNIKIGTDFYATCSCSPIYIFLCTVLVTLLRLGRISYHLMIPEPCSTHQYLYARWSTFSDRFHTVSFTMQLHDQNSTLSLSILFFSSPRSFKVTQYRTSWQSRDWTWLPIFPSTLQLLIGFYSR